MAGRAEIEEAIEALGAAEKLVASVDRAALLSKLDEIRDFIEDLTRLQLDMRIARLRLQSMLPPEDSAHPGALSRKGPEK